ncbi:hypothetical protein N7488_001775 [Penicillium malachiteum]|nr:hypothetical protein N7488_001775 [Penicillium malachiteum]
MIIPSEPFIAHKIRNSSTRTFKATMKLEAKMRWCLSGTPIQNTLKDIESLAQFLRVPILGIPAMFRRYVAGVSDQLPNYNNLRLLLESICLRRTIALLPDLGVSIQKYQIIAGESERRQYKIWEMFFRERIKAAVGQRPTQRGSSVILMSILLLRIFCNIGMHSNLALETFLNNSHPYELHSLGLQKEDTVCMGCHNDLPSSTGNSTADQRNLLQSILCLECMPRASALAQLPLSQSSHSGPDCIPTNESSSDESVTTVEELAQKVHQSRDSHYPSKLLKVLSDIKEHYTEKSIVFSFWKGSLDLLGGLLKKEGVTFCRIDGSFHPNRRKEILSGFQHDESQRVLLMTFGTGSTGLNNLCVASRVHILEPQWNPSVERQAIGRVLRLGQKRKVFVIHYIVQNTIEELLHTWIPGALYAALT